MIHKMTEKKLSNRERANKLFLVGYSRKQISKTIGVNLCTVGRYMKALDYQIDESKPMFYEEMYSLFKMGLTAPEIAERVNERVADVRNALNNRFPNSDIRDRFRVELRNRCESLEYVSYKYKLPRDFVERLIND